MEIIRIYSVLSKAYVKDGLWSLDLKTEAGEATPETTKTVTFDDKAMAEKFKFFIDNSLPTIISNRMQELAEELFSLQEMVDSGELYWQLGTEDDEDNEDDEDFFSNPSGPKYLD